MNKCIVIVKTSFESMPPAHYVDHLRSQMAIKKVHVYVKLLHRKLPEIAVNRQVIFEAMSQG